MTMTGEQIYANFYGKASENFQMAAIQVTNVSSKYQSIAERFAAVQQRMMNSWTGGAADDAKAGAAPLESTLRQSVKRLDRYGTGHGDQSNAFDAASRDVIPVPDKPALPNGFEVVKKVVTGGGGAMVADYLAQVEAYNAAQTHNVGVMTRYQEATTVNQDIPADYPRPDRGGGTVTKEVEGEPPDNTVTAHPLEDPNGRGGGDPDGESGGGGGTQSGSHGGSGSGPNGVPPGGGLKDLTSLSDAGNGTPPGGPSNPLPPTGPNNPPGPSNPNGPFGSVLANPNPKAVIPDCGPGIKPHFNDDSNDDPNDPNDPNNPNDLPDLGDRDDPNDRTTTSVVGPAAGGSSGWPGGTSGRYTSDAWSTGDGGARNGQAGAGGVFGGGAGGPGGPGLGAVGAGGAGLAGAARGRGGAGGFGGAMPGSRGKGDDDTEHTRPEFLIEPDPNAVFGTDAPSSAPVIGETWKPE